MRDLVYFPDLRRARTQAGGLWLLGLLFLGLLAGTIWMMVDTGSWMPLMAVPILGLALAGLWIQRRPASAEGVGGPVLIANQRGIGDHRLFVPWEDVRELRVRHQLNRTVMPSIGRTIANKLSDATGVLDGSFVLTLVTARGPVGQPLPGRHRVDGHTVEYRLDLDIPSAHWAPIADDLRARARAHGIPTD